MRMNSALLLTSLCLALSLAGCANLTPPAADDAYNQAMRGAALPDSWAASTARAAFQPEWLGFAKSGEVQQLIDEALAHNPDLRAAASRGGAAMNRSRRGSSNLSPGHPSGVAT